MADIGIIGGVNVVGLFKMMDVKIYPADNAEQAKAALGKVIEEGKMKICFILESLASHMVDEIRKADEMKTMTVIVPLPDHVSEVSYLDDKLKRLSREAIGMEI